MLRSVLNIQTPDWLWSSVECKSISIKESRPNFSRVLQDTVHVVVIRIIPDSWKHLKHMNVFWLYVDILWLKGFWVTIRWARWWQDKVPASHVTLKSKLPVLWLFFHLSLSLMEMQAVHIFYRCCPLKPAFLQWQTCCNCKISWKNRSKQQEVESFFCFFLQNLHFHCSLSWVFLKFLW